MKLNDFTALARTPIDLSYPTNRAIAVLTTVVTIAGAILRLLRGTTPLESVLWGIAAGLAVFLTWALGRELDPDHDLSAFVGAGLVFIALLLVDAPSLLLILWLLSVLRTVNRTVGLPAKPLDSLWVLGLSAWLTWQGYWMVGLVTAVAFLLDGLLPPPLRRQLLASGLAFLATVILSIFHGERAMETEPTLLVVVLSIAVVGCGGCDARAADPQAGPDRPGARPAHCAPFRLVGWGLWCCGPAAALGGDDRCRRLSTGDTVSAAASLIPEGG
jgi:hypothetical protein